MSEHKGVRGVNSACGGVLWLLASQVEACGRRIGFVGVCGCNNLACYLENFCRTRAPSALRASGTVARGVASVRRGRVKIRLGRAICF